MTGDEDALDSYLVWELCKQEGIQRKIIERSADRNQLRDFFNNIKQEYYGKHYEIEEKKDLLRELDNNPDYRTMIFEECSWRKEPVTVDDIGTTLPQCGDLPPEVITRSLPEVVEFVEEADPEHYRSVRYIKILTELPELLDEFLPWVVTPGNRKNKLDRMNSVHGETDWNIADTWGMINDGNHRAIAKVLADNSEETVCHVGHRKND